MDKNKIIILALIAIIAALLVGFVAMMPNTNKEDTKLTFEGNSTIADGDSIKIKLTDDNGTGLANKEVSMAITDENNTSNQHSVITDKNGVGTLKIDKNAGNYTITANYSGDENYTGCNATKKITVEEEVVEEPVAQQQTQSSQSAQPAKTSSSSNGLHYDAEVNVYYDDNGIIVDPDGEHGQGVGTRYSDVRDARDRWERGEPVMV